MLRYFRWQLLIAALAISTGAVLLWRIAFTSATVVVPASGGTYVEAVDERPRYLNPLLAQPGTLDSDLCALIFSGLVRLAPSGEAAPDLAESWEVSGDGRTYSVHLKAGIRWHDGEPFSADDVLFTISLLKDPDFQGNPALAELWHDINVSKTDDLTIQFQLQDAFAPFIEYLTLGILPKHLLSNAQTATLPADPFNASPVGTGPFRVREVNVERIDLEPFSYYYGQQPYLQRLVFQFYPNPEAAL
ncbi:MAG: peptide ABC transporter substrate-binding protein, partial [Chloroflexi bacterium]|nr:peptide ABC transporter substrate-binding protein [Chloroflexota bacterium]